MHVVAAVLEDAAGRVLFAQRPPGKQHAGRWEFPGGKIEADESAFAALCRELREELGIDVIAASRLMCVHRPHPNGMLALEAWRVTAWCGAPVAHEHSALRWLPVPQGLQLDLCAADVVIARALALPHHYAITPEPGADVSAFLARIESGLERGLRLLQWRAPGLDARRYREIAITLRERSTQHGARLLLNADPALALELGADGVHLDARRLAATHARPEAPDGFLVAASCHDEQELRHASVIGADFVVLSAVRPTPTHPGVSALGWEAWERLLHGADVPAYALGGVGPADLCTAKRHGALGVAGISAFW